MSQLDAPHGWVVAGTGNGTVHEALQAVLLDAQAQGAKVWRASRCAWGGVQTRDGDVFTHAGPLSAAQARVALVLALIAEQQP
jgi:L-asparaginase